MWARRPYRRVGNSTYRPRSPVPVVAKSTSPNRPGCAAIRSAIPRMSGRGAGKPRDWEKRTATWSVPASSSQATPVLPTAPRRPIIPSRTSPRRCSAFLPRAVPSRKKRPSQSRADKRRQHLSEAPARVRHVTAPSRGRALSKPAGAQGSKLRGSVAPHWLLPAAPHIPPEAPTSDPQHGDGLILPDPRSRGLRHR